MPHRIEIVAQGPLAFPTRKQGEQFARSFPYIPGSALWGALGMRLQAIPQARFSHALPARAGDAWARLLPATAMSCKRHGGFLADDPGHHGVFDTLIDRVCWEQLRPAAFTYDPHCPTCLGRADSPPGPIYAQARDGTIRARRVQQRTLTRVAIDRRRGTAAEELLYSPIVIAEVSVYPADDPSAEASYEPTRFTATAWELGEHAGELALVTGLGGRISSGLGRVTIAVHDEPTAAPEPWRLPLAERLRRFNAVFAARWALAERSVPTADPGWAPGAWRVFSVGLQREAVLLEEDWRPAIVFSETQFQALTELDATLVRAQASGQVVGGWNVRYNRHRPTVLTAVAGSVYLFRTRAGEPELIAALTKLEQEGIGARRGEGYGIVYCCDEFHIQATGAAL